MQLRHSKVNTKSMHKAYSTKVPWHYPLLQNVGLPLKFFACRPDDWWLAHICLKMGLHTTNAYTTAKPSSHLSQRRGIPCHWWRCRRPTHPSYGGNGWAFLLRYPDLANPGIDEREPSGSWCDPYEWITHRSRWRFSGRIIAFGDLICQN